MGGAQCVGPGGGFAVWHVEGNTQELPFELCGCMYRHLIMPNGCEGRQRGVERLAACLLCTCHHVACVRGAERL